MEKQNRYHLILSTLLLLSAGLLQGFALAGPISGEPSSFLGLLGLSLLAWALLAAPNRRCAIIWTISFFWGFMSATVWWLVISLHSYGNIPLFLACVAVALFCAFLALQYSIWMLLAYTRLRQASPLGSVSRDRSNTPSTKPLPRLWAFSLLFASAFTLAELTRAILFTGFPWGSVGYSQIDGLLAGFAPWLGVYGVGWLTAWLAALFGSTFFIAWQKSYTSRKTKTTLQATWPYLLRAGGATLALYTLLLIVPSTKLHMQASTSVALVQGNIAQNEKFQTQTGVTQALQGYTNAVSQSTASLTITPETAVPLPQTHLPLDTWNTLQQQLVQENRVALIGIPYVQAIPAPTASEHSARPVIGYQYSNAVLALGNLAQTSGLTVASDWDGLWRYDKHHLVPFGERIPPFFAWFVRVMGIPFSNFAAGPALAPNLNWDGNRFALTVCYEDLFSKELALRFSKPEQAPTVLVNMSNLAWFSNPSIHSTAIAQHLQIARMRSLELARPSIRATNTGATAIIDETGQVQALLPYDQVGVLQGQVRGVQGNTAYATWASHWGLWPLGVSCTLLFCLAWIGLTKPHRSKESTG